MPPFLPVISSSDYDDQERHGEFIGRKLELKSLHTNLIDNYSKPVVIAGISGLGKTALVHSYAYEKRTDYDGPVFLINACLENLEEQFLDCAQQYILRSKGLDVLAEGRIGINQFLDYYLDGYDSEVAKALVIFDNALPTASFDAFLSLLYKSRHKGVRILVTTKLSTTQFIGLAGMLEEFPLQKLSPNDAIKLLTEWLKSVGESLDSESQREKALSICIRAGYLPFYLRWVGRYLLEHRHDSFEQLHAKLTTSLTPSTNMELEGAPLARFNQIWRELDESAHRLGILASLFFESKIPVELVDLVAEEAGLQAWDIEHSKEALVSYFFAELTTNKGKKFWDIHAPIRTFLTLKRSENRDGLDLKSAYIRALCKFSARFVPDFTTRELQKLAPTIPHLEKMLSHEQQHDVPNEYLWSLFRTVIYFYLNQGMFDGSEDTLNRALKYAEKAQCVLEDRLGENHLSYIMNLNAIAYIYTQQGFFHNAESYYMRAISRIIEAFSENCFYLIEDYNGLGYLYERQNILEEAKNSYLKALELIEHYYVGESSDEQRNIGSKRIETLTNIGNVYYAMDLPQLSLEYYEQALEGSRILYKESDPEISLYKIYLANAHTRLGNLNTAKTLYLEAIRNAKRHFGERHISLATSFNNLAMIYYRQEDFAKAKEYYKKDIEITKKINKTHPDIGASLNNLAAVYMAEQDYDKAEKIYKESILRGKEHLPGMYPDVVLRQKNLAQMYIKQKRFTKARQCYKEVIHDFKKQNSFQSSEKLELEISDVCVELNKLDKVVNRLRVYKYCSFLSLVVAAAIFTIFIHTGKLYWLIPLIVALFFALRSLSHIYLRKLHAE